MDIDYHNNNNDSTYLKLFCDPNIGTLIFIFVLGFLWLLSYTFLPPNEWPLFLKKKYPINILQIVVSLPVNRLLFFKYPVNDIIYR